jgi:hypothetical protein
LARLAVSPIPVHDYSSLLFPPVAEKSRQVYEEYVQVNICIMKVIKSVFLTSTVNLVRFRKSKAEQICKLLRLISNISLDFI